MSEPPKIVLLTPVRNEVLMLPRFLATSSHWADLIIIADQGSTDGSAEVCAAYPKVIVLKNASQAYDEAGRQSLLIGEARTRVEGLKILIAADADEILAGDAQSSPDWLRMLAAPSGATLAFEKPDILAGGRQCIRFASALKPMGFVDNGAPHQSALIHSRRIPSSTEGETIPLAGIKFLHYNLLRPSVHAAKRRLYCVIEAVAGTKSWVRRVVDYKADIDWTAQGPVEECPQEWFERWEEVGIDMKSVEDPSFNWHDLEVLRFMGRVGERRLYLEDIWDFDWEECRRWAIEVGADGIPQKPIEGPSIATRSAVRICQTAIELGRRVYRRLRVRRKM